MSLQPLLIGGRPLMLGNRTLDVNGGATPPAYATTFSVSLSASTGNVGATKTATIAPINGSWPVNQQIVLTTSGVACAFTPDNRIGSGTAPVTFSFTPSAAGALSVNATASGMTSTGAQSYTVNSSVTPPTPTSAGNRYDVVFGKSAYAPGDTVSGNLIPNGLWTGGNVLLTPDSGSAITTALPTSGAASVPFSFTAPGAGSNFYTPTNTAGLYNPGRVQLNVFASASGTSRTFSASVLGTTPDLRTFQRDAPSGDATGFTLGGVGWGAVPISISSLSGATNGIWMRPYDPASSGATAATGTGTALHAAVQVHGALGASGMIYPLLPASLNFIYWDIATDAAFTAPVRIAQRIRVGIIVGDMSRSQETGFANSYADSTAFTAINTRFATWTASDPRYPADAYSGVHWGISTDTSAGQELARILEAQFGVGVAVTGVSATFGGFDKFFGHDGTPTTPFTATVSVSCDNKFRYFTASMGGWDGDDSAYPTETYAEVQTRIQAGVVKIAQMYPYCAVIRWCTSASGWFGSDGSRDLGYTRLNQIVRTVESANRMVVGGESTLWNEFTNGHATQGARKDYARTAARMLASVETGGMGGLGTPNRGPTLAATGTLSGRTVSIGFMLNGGNALTSVKVAYSNPNATYGTASTVELASLFSIYAGANGRSGAGQAIKIASAAINSGTGKIDLVLVGSSGVTYADGSTGSMPSQLSINYGADYGASNTTVQPQYAVGGAGVGISLCDNTSEYTIPYGRLMRPAIDILVTV